MHTPSVDPTERLFNPQTVCVWASGVYIARALLGDAVPNTKAEVLALAADSGVPGGASGNYTKLAYGMAKRYGLKGLVYEVDAEAKAKVLEAAARGPHAVAIAGDQYNLTPRWQNGHVGHSIAVIYEHGTTGVQFDPLAPAGYKGDSFPPAELEKYATAAIIFKESKEDSMPGFKMSAPIIGKITVSGPGVLLISPTDTKVRYPQSAGAQFDVYASLDLKAPSGASLDVDGNSPALNKRDQVYVVDMPGFGLAAYMLRQNGSFTPVPKGHTDLELKAAASGAAHAVAAASVSEAKLYD